MQTTALPREPATVIIIFGISGDLARRKLIPALFALFTDGGIPRDTYIIGVSRRRPTDEELRTFTHSKQAQGSWKSFAKQIRFFQGDASNPAMYPALAKTLGILRSGAHCQNRLFYFAVSPELHAGIATHLRGVLLSAGCAAHGAFSRIIIEKPFGTDLDSARRLNRSLRRCFDEEQIYRIDHYLGKEAVQNILTFRFANDIFAPLWNRDGIDHVQITAAESIGIEHRGAYYDATGALRDMVQNHLLQLTAHIAMAEPLSFKAQHVRRERIRILETLRPHVPERIAPGIVRAQYRDGSIEGATVAAYRDEARVAANSRTETYVAQRLTLDHEYWRGVPFYLRTGKRLAGKYTEIAIQFKERSRHLFKQYPGDRPNAIFFRIQPDDSITIRFTIKEPGITQRVRTADSTLCYSQAFTMRSPDAHERLINDALQGDQTLFTHTNEVEAQWRFVEAATASWKNFKHTPLHTYRAGSWGPQAADTLIERDGRKWMPYKPGICVPLR